MFGMLRFTERTLGKLKTCLEIKYINDMLFGVLNIILAIQMEIAI